MKVKIRYEYDAKYGDRTYWAIAGELCKASGTSFEDAKERLMAVLTAAPIEVPPEEEVEI